MENEEKDIFAGSGGETEGQPRYSPHIARPVETAADKYGEFVDRAESSQTPSLSLEEEANSLEKDFSIKKKSLIPALPLDKKKLLPIIVVILLILIAAAGISYFKGKKNITGNSSENSNNVVVDSAMEKMKNIQSYSFDGTMDFDRTVASGGNEYGMEYQIIYKGVSDKGTQGDPSVYSSIVYDTVRSVGESKKETSIGMQSVIIGGRQYLKLDNLLIAGTDRASKSAIMENNLKGYSGIWYSVSELNYKNFYTEVKDYAFLPDNLNIFDVKSVEGFNEVFNHKLLSSAQDLGAEPVGEVEATHYKVGLNTQGVIELVSSLAQKGANQETDSDMTKILQELQNNPQEGDKFKKMVDYVMQSVSVEIWIGKNDGLVYRFKISGNFDGNVIKGFYGKLGEVYGGSYAPQEGGIEEKGMKFDIDYTLSGFNSTKVREPEGAKDFTEVLEKLKSINPNMVVNTKTSTSSIDTDTDGLTDEQEKIYGTDASKPDTDGDGYKDGAEVKSGYDPAVAGSARLDYGKLNKAQ